MADLNKIKRRLGIADNLQDDLLTDLIDDGEQLFKMITGTNAVDDKYSFMVESAVYQLYARKGSEGIESETVDGYSVKYAMTLYDDFMPILERDFELDDNSYRKSGSVSVW